MEKLRIQRSIATQYSAIFYHILPVNERGCKQIETLKKAYTRTSKLYNESRKGT